MGIKKQLILMTIILLLLAGRVNASGDACEIINTGKWTIDELNVLIVKASKIKDSSERISFYLQTISGPSIPGENISRRCADSRSSYDKPGGS